MLIKLIHGNIDLYSEISEEARKAVLQQFLKIKSDLKQHKSTILNEVLSLNKQINSAAQKMLELVKFQEKKLDKIILKVQNLERINNDKETTFIKSTLNISSTNLSKIQLINCPCLDTSTIDSKTIQKLFKLDELSEENFLLDMNYENHENKFKYIDKNVLWTFNAKTKNFNKKELPIGIWFYCNGDMPCFLPDGSIFYYNYNSSIIINPSDSIKYLPKWNIRTRVSWSIYKNGDIYLFGDANGTSAKFSITKNKWTPITKFSIKLKISASPLIFKDYILLWTNESYLVCYDTIIDSLSNFLFPKAKQALLIFFVVNETLYFIDFWNKKYGMTDNLITWNEIEDQSLSLNFLVDFVYSPIIYNQEYYYMGSSAIFAFDLKNKENREVCKRPR